MFCFMIKEECKKQECTAWKNEECILTKFLETSIEHIENIEYIINDYLEKSIKTSTEIIDNLKLQLDNSEKITSEYVNINTSEEMAIELSEYMENNGHYYRINHVEESNFWLSKGISSIYSLPIEIQQKIKVSNTLANDILTNKREIELSKEKEEISNLADLCVEWARSQGMKNIITRPTMEAFLTEKDIDLFYESKTMLYNLANMKSKIK